MTKKIWMIGIVVGGVILCELLILALHDFFQDAADIAVNGSIYSNNMTGLVPAASSMPFWILFLAPVVGIVSIIMILRMPEQR